MLKSRLRDLKNGPAPGGEDDAPILHLCNGTQLTALEFLHQLAAGEDAGERIKLICAVSGLDGHGYTVSF